MKLIFTIIISLICTGIAYLLVQTWGWGQSYISYDDNFFNTETNNPESDAGPNPNLNANGKSKMIYVSRGNTTAELGANLLLGDDSIVWLDVYDTADHELVLINPSQINSFLRKEKTSKLNWKGNEINRYYFKELNGFFPELQKFEDQIDKIRERRKIINVVSNVSNIHEALSEKIRKLKKSEQKIIIQSDTSVILTSMKELNPTWLYGSSQPDLMRLLSFESVKLLSAAPFKGDVFISPIFWHNRSVLNANVIEEIRRRKKFVILGPIETQTQFEEVFNLSPNAIMIENPEIAKEWIKQKENQ